MSYLPLRYHENLEVIVGVKRSSYLIIEMKVNFLTAVIILVKIVAVCRGVLYFNHNVFLLKHILLYTI